MEHILNCNQWIEGLRRPEPGTGTMRLVAVESVLARTPLCMHIYPLRRRRMVSIDVRVEEMRSRHGNDFSVVGLLHDPAYLEAYASDLKKMLPHIPTPETRQRFEQLASAGHSLADLHVDYESVEPYPLDVQLKSGSSATDRETWRVSKMKWGKKKDPETGKCIGDRTTLIYSPKVTIAGIPEEAERYMLGSRSALAWIIDRYQVKTDKASGIVNDPNDWCDEHNVTTFLPSGNGGLRGFDPVGV